MVAISEAAVETVAALIDTAAVAAMAALVAVNIAKVALEESLRRRKCSCGIMNKRDGFEITKKQ